MRGSFRDAATLDQVKTALNYDPLTGVFLWKERPSLPKEWNTRWAGKPAGYNSPRPNGGFTQTCIRLDGVLYLAHRVAWLYVYGVWPNQILDHKNGNPSDNRIANLRLCTFVQNSQNRTVQQNSKSGIKGVGRHGPNWRARIAHNGKVIQKVFSTMEAAEKWHKQTERALLGEFARS